MIPLSIINGGRRQQFQQLRPVPEGEPIPSFNLLLSDGITTLCTRDIPTGSPVVLVLFSPDCPYCLTEIDSIVTHLPTLTDIRFYFITPCPMAQVQQFAADYRLHKYPNVVVGMDPVNFLLRFSGTKVIPYTAIYDGNKRLIEAVFGQADDRKIKEIIYG